MRRRAFEPLVAELRAVADRRCGGGERAEPSLRKSTYSKGTTAPAPVAGLQEGGGVLDQDKALAVSCLQLLLLMVSAPASVLERAAYRSDLAYLGLDALLAELRRTARDDFDLMCLTEQYLLRPTKSMDRPKTILEWNVP